MGFPEGAIAFRDYKHWLSEDWLVGWKYQPPGLRGEIRQESFVPKHIISTRNTTANHNMKLDLNTEVEQYRGPSNDYQQKPLDPMEDVTRLANDRASKWEAKGSNIAGTVV